ncbi:MAG: HDOD domain-containing protein [Desulfobacterales bacterium]|nr:HDOD domain-containing protein [Desulfobacterales bacterium]
MSQLEPLVIDPETFLYKHCTLPALPEVLTEFQEIMNSPNAGAKEIAEIINKDPAAVAQILKIINSAYYSLPVEFSEVKLAVAYLGINEVYRIILSISVINTLSTKEKDEFDHIWSHSLLTAFCAKYFAQKFEPLVDKNELWTIAILHDIGKLVYLKFFPKHYLELRNYCKKNSCLFSQAENDLAFPSSSYLGMLLCERWRLPDKIKKVCSSHGLHDLQKIDEENSKNSYRTMVILGNLVAALSTDELNQETKIEITDEIKNSLSIDESDFLLIMGDIVQLKEEASRLFS